MIRRCFSIALLAVAAVSAQQPASTTSQAALEARLSVLETKVQTLEQKVDRLQNASKPAPVVVAPATQPAVAVAPATPAVPAGLPQDNLVPAKLLSKKLLPASGGYPDMMVTLIQFENHGDKEIGSIKGNLVFVDALSGDSLTCMAVELNKAIPSLGNTSWQGGLDYNAGDVGQIRFMNLGQNQALIRFKLNRVLFTNGTVRQYN